jgi:hypothetical protein
MASSKNASKTRIIDHPSPLLVLWRHFGFQPINDQSEIPNRECAICKMCLQKFETKIDNGSYYRKLKVHLAKYHPELVDE